MIDRIIEFSLRNRFVVVAAYLLLAGWGYWALTRTPVDAIPDLSDNQVIVFTDWVGRSPQEVEDQVTYPLTTTLQGLPGVRTVRGQSAFGFAMINVIFEDSVDLYWARTRVLERLNLVTRQLPEGVVPTLGPDASGVGQIFWYTVEGEGYDLRDLRTLQDWFIRYQLNSVPGVSEVASVGGHVQQYQIDVDPNRLRAYNIPFSSVVEAVRRSNTNVGGNVVEQNGQWSVVRGVGLIGSVEDIDNIVIGGSGGTPIYVRNVATTKIGGAFRVGALDRDGKEAVGGVVIARYGVNSLEVINAVKEKIESLQTGLPESVKINPFYDRTELILRATDTLKRALIEELILVTLVHIVFLFHFRSILIVTIPLPLAVLASFLFMYYMGISSNLMSLSGIAIAIGVLVDAGIVVTETNRASVVVYTIDPRGLQTTGLTPADNTAFMTTREVDQRVGDRSTQLFESQGGLNYLAHQTGGFFVRNTNSLTDGIGRVLDDQKGYYLLGYVPNETTFKREQGKRTFHNISVRLKRAGLRVRSRTGFYGVSDEESGPADSTGAQQLVTALTSPFASGDIHLKLTSLFGHEEKEGAFMRSIMHIDARDISFSEEADGSRKGVIEIVAFTIGGNGEIVGREARGYNLSVRGDGFQKLLDNGFTYALNVPIKKAGGYQLRIAVRDPRAERVGSASQFIEVPDIGSNRLTLSGIVVSGYDPAIAQAGATHNTVSVEAIDPASIPAVRMLKRGTYLDYGYLIYNAQLDSRTKKPQLETQLILLKDGKQVFATKASPLELGDEPDWKHIPSSGRLQLGDDLAPGEYILQIIVNDKLAKEKYRWASQWMDFEIVK